MGTRSWIDVIIDGELKVRQYGQWDGYYEGQGAEIAKFLHQVMDKEKFCAALRECQPLTKEEIDTINRDFGNGEWKKRFPWLSREAGAEVLAHIQNDGARKLLHDGDDGKGWIEFHYIIDMDKETVTVNGRGRSNRRSFKTWTVGEMKRLADKNR